MLSRASLPIILFLFAAALLWLYLSVAGTVVVRDPTGEVVRAFITDDHDEQGLHRLPGGVFVGVPGLEGVAVIACRGGRARAHGYVTGGMHTRLEAGPGCRLADDR
jgi:hypothetical protein